MRAERSDGVPRIEIFGSQAVTVLELDRDARHLAQHALDIGELEFLQILFGNERGAAGYLACGFGGAENGHRRERHRHFFRLFGFGYRAWTGTIGPRLVLIICLDGRGMQKTAASSIAGPSGLAVGLCRSCCFGYITQELLL